MSAEYKDMGLDDLLKALKDEKFPVVKLGVLSDGSNREGEADNAGIGAVHEFGTSKTPMRSFLRGPTAEKLKKYLEDAGAFDESAIKDIIKTKSFYNFVKKMGLVGERIVADAFATGGFGEWAESNMKYKKNHQTLVETQQLRDSISSEVVEE